MNFFDQCLGKFCLIRTYSAGVHFGYLKDILTAADGFDVLMTDVRKIYSWEGALTLNEIAQKGIKPSSKLSVSVPVNYLRAIEILPIEPAAAKILNGIKPYEP